MDYPKSDFAQDIRRVSQIQIVPTLLDVICETTGMGFAAVARVTEDRWITCSVRDDIQFGLVPGSELEIKTTICNEIRDSGQPVVIDHVQANALFCRHHTPLTYGFQSYISYPIFLKTGSFFGTLCAIDPSPAQLDNHKIRGMFAAFADLISFHLQQIELLEHSDHAVRNLSRQLINSLDENRQYRHISSHTLQEPLRKLRIFSGMLVDSIRGQHLEKAEQLALRINSGAERFSTLIKNLSSFASLETSESKIQPTDLEYIVGLVCAQMRSELEEKKATIQVGVLPTVTGIPDQLEQLFHHLFENALKFAKDSVPLTLSIHCKAIVYYENAGGGLPDGQYVEILITDNGIGIEQSQLEKIFDMFSQLTPDPRELSEGIGLTICRKIVRNHSGQISITSQENVGTTVSLTLPVEQTFNEYHTIQF
ncbi:ATP-binding protein [Dyadobacter sp. CY261]|uniref:GAF domain-containing sensor histidine kinase n=1 Tax=Dyadobacter sp. CY261 TaxID=2907203 RepID=UPI001F3FE64A|nr:ATP-binding protein [Dyadobacter sp. CY261]MCF0072860.1 ATP-binding protein [Dyadobacter sp. CY261]